MKIGFVSPRYGTDVAGGAELLVRQHAERAAARGHDVCVFTTCASSHYTWANDLAPGVAWINGIRVERHPVTTTPDGVVRERLHRCLVAGVPPTETMGHEWLHNVGFSQPLLDAVDRSGATLDALIFAPYLYPSTVYGAALHPGKSAIMPCLHDESYARFPVIQRSLRNAASLIFNTEAEAQVARDLLGMLPPYSVVGAGFDTVAADSHRFRGPHAGVRDFVAHAGRLEPAKNYHLLLEWLTAHNSFLCPDSPIDLVALGRGAYTVPSRARAFVHDIGFVSEQEKLDALSAAIAVVNLSVMESFSYLVMESWQVGRPVIVHADCTVTRQHCEASGGGLWVRSAEEFSAALDRLRSDPALASALGLAGQSYVGREYSWDAVGARMDAALAAMATGACAPA